MLFSRNKVKRDDASKTGGRKAKIVESKEESTSVETDDKVPGTFEEAFAGKWDWLTKKISISSGILNCIEPRIINHRQRQQIESKTNATEDEQVECLLKVLFRCDDSKLNEFFDALIATDQQHVVEYIIGRKLHSKEFTVNSETRFRFDREQDLIQYMDPGVADTLHDLGAIEDDDLLAIKEQSTLQKQNRLIMQCISRKNDATAYCKLTRALEITDQKHVANFIICDGDISKINHDERNVWPLPNELVAKIDNNLSSLVDLTDIQGGLIDNLLTSPKCITDSQKIHIDSCRDHIQKTKNLFSFLLRRSVSNFHAFRHRMKNSGQQKLAQFLKKTGVIALIKAHIKKPGGVDDRHAEWRTLTPWLCGHLVNLISVKECLYFYFTLDSRCGLHYLQYMYIRGYLQLAIERMFNSVSVREPRVSISHLVWEPDSINCCEQYFNVVFGDDATEAANCNLKPFLGLWLPTDVLETIIIKSCSLLPLSKKTGFTVLASVCRIWWNVIAGRKSISIDSTGNISATKRTRSIMEQPLELLEIVLQKAYIMAFGDSLITEEVEQLAYKMLAGVSSNWRQTLIGWPWSNTRHWMKHQIRRHINYLRRKQQDEYIRSLNQLFAKHIFSHKRRLEWYTLQEAAASATRRRYLKELSGCRPQAQKILTDIQTTEISDTWVGARGNSMKVFESMDAKGVAVDMFLRHTLTYAELEDINASETDGQAGQKLLKILADQPREMFDCFLEILRSTGQEELYLRYVMNEYDITTLYNRPNMHPEYIAYLVDAMDATQSGLTSQLVADFVLTEIEKEEVDAEPTSARQNMRLMSLLSHKTTLEFELFVKALDRSSQHHVVDRITGERRDAGLQPSLSKVLADTSGHEEELKRGLALTRAALEFMMDAVYYHVKDRIQRDTEYLKEIIEVDYGLLDHLTSLGVLTYRECLAVSGESTVFKRLDRLLDLMMTKSEVQYRDFMVALMRTDQQHVANYIQRDIDDEFGDVRPLDQATIQHIARNTTRLVELLDPDVGFLADLVDAGSITQRQGIILMTIQHPPDKNRKLMDILRRRSFAHFRQFIDVLINNEKSHLVPFLMKTRDILCSNNRAAARQKVVPPFVLRKNKKRGSRVLSVIHRLNPCCEGCEK